MNLIDSELASTPVETPDYSQQPKYIQSLQLHNTASGNDSIVGDIGNFFSSIGQSIKNAPKFFEASAISGVIGVVNTGIAIGNFVSSKKTEEVNTQKWFNDYDSDLGRYYRDNANAIDVTGFLLTSVVPGGLGVKGLNLAQMGLKTATKTGMMGKSLSVATKLLVPETDKYILNSARTMAAVRQKFKFTEVNNLKALGTGLHQNVLEAAAFETFALAGNFKSPFFSDMDAGDIAANFATGVVLGGALGGVFAGFKSRKAINKEIKRLDDIGRPGMLTPSLSDALPANMHIAKAFDNRATVENFLAANKLGPAPGALLPDGRNLEIVNAQVADAQRTIESLNNQIRTWTRKLSSSDDVASNFSELLIKMDSKDGKNLMLGSGALTRVGEVVVPKLGKTKGGQLQLDLIDKGVPTAIDSATSGIQWNKLYGANAGEVFDELPLASALADRVKMKSGETLQQAVERTAKSHSHSWKTPVDVLGSKLSLSRAQSRYLVADRFNLKDTVAISINDIPVLESAYNQFDNITKINIVNSKGKVVATPTTKDQFLSQITTIKDRQIARAKKRGMSDAEIAARLNVREEFINGTKVANDQYDNYFARQTYAKELGLTPQQLAYKPSYMGVKQDQTMLDVLSDTAIDAEMVLKAAGRQAQATVNNAVADAGAYLGESEIKDMATGAKMRINLANALPENEVFQQLITDADRFGSGATILSFSNGNYGSLESFVQYIGQLKREMDRVGTELVHTEWTDIAKTLKNDVAGAAEFSLLNETVARMPIGYTTHPTQSKLIPLVHLDDMRAGKDLRQLDSGVLPEIPINNPAVYEAAATHIKLNGQRIEGVRALRSAGSGIEVHLDSRKFQPVLPDPQSLPFFALVKDPTIIGAGATTMIHATNARTLADMIQKVSNSFPKWKVLTKKDTEEFHKAMGEFDYSKTMNSNRIDSELQSRGINSQALPQTDGKLVMDKFETWHSRQVRAYNSEIVSTKYAQEFDVLEKLGREFSNLSEAKYPDATALAVNVKHNPFVEYTKTALNISNLSDYTWLTNTNRYLDAVVSNVWNNASALMKQMKGVKQGELDTVNKVFEDAGFKTAYYDAATHLLANHPADQAVLSRFIRGANSILATTFLRMDWMNSINNKIGSVILTSTEMRHLLRAIENGNSEIAGKLAGLTKVKVPGTDDMVLSPSKLMMRAYSNFVKDKARVQEAIESGIVPRDLTDAFRVIDDLTIKGNETGLDLGKKLESALKGAQKIANFGEKWTGNRLVEGLNRFVSYDVMRQVTDLAEQAGLITAKESKSYINTFVNRTQVTLNASQRPLIFQGPIGMAMGLFQSYQFNLMQQLFRYAGDGSRKTAAYMMGMQGSMYGLNGLPGYQAFNEHIIGQAAGNYEHKDINQTLREGAGNDIANFLLYGAPSNILRANIYTRGDLTPHNPTILPSSIGDVVAVNMYGNFFGNLKTTLSNMANGAGIWKSVLQGLEHNSLNRPLAGLAQTLRGLDNGNVYSTTRAGDVLAGNDLLSLATLARIAGGKPLDEAIVRDERWRISLYRQADLARRKRASEALRTSLADSGEASEAQMDSVFNIYLNTGGKTKDFNKWFMSQYNKANTSEAEKLANSLNSPYADRMQKLLDGSSDTVRFDIQ